MAYLRLRKGGKWLVAGPFARTNWHNFWQSHRSKLANNLATELAAEPAALPLKAGTVKYDCEHHRPAYDILSGLGEAAMWEWGSVPGDSEADGIIAERREIRTRLGTGNKWLFIATTVSAVVYAFSGSPVALAAEVFLMGNVAVGWLQRDLYEAHTILLIAERRTQLVEQRLQELELRSSFGA